MQGAAWSMEAQVLLQTRVAEHMAALQSHGAPRVLALIATRRRHHRPCALRHRHHRARRDSWQ